jgi:hypothetical protein
MLAVGAGVAGLALGGHSGRFGGVPPTVRAPAGGAAALADPARGSRWAARPVSLVIPAIGVRTGLTRLGVSPSGAMQVPPTAAVAGWFTASPRPGAIGPAVIAGHIDSRTGPGIFFRLRQLRRGDLVYVRRADGTLAVFAVRAVRRYAKDRFPAAAVYGAVPDAELRLITCGGTFDYATESYLSNVVVYASLVRPRARHLVSSRRPGMRAEVPPRYSP